MLEFSNIHRIEHKDAREITGNSPVQGQSMTVKTDKTAGLLQEVSDEGQKLPVAERRNFLKQGLLLAGSAIAGGAISQQAKAAGENLPPNVPTWSRSLGSGVLTNPYGKPSRFENHIVRRNVPWLTADNIAAISFTPLAELDGESRVMIDAGGGTFLRFGEAEAKFASLDFVGLSHFHTDHSADLPALLKSGYFSGRQRSLVVAGPESSPPFPGLVTYLNSMLGKPDGAYAYLSGYLDGTGGLSKIEPFEVEKGNSTAVTVLGEDGGPVQITAQHVPHGIVPALAFRVRIGAESIVFASDQNGNDPAFVDFAKDATILLMHMVVPESISGAGRKLHAPPSVIGDIAQRAGVGTLVLST